MVQYTGVIYHGCTYSMVQYTQSKVYFNCIYCLLEYLLSAIVLSKVIGARVSVYGLLNFSRNGNTVFDSGALYVTSLGQVELFPGARMNFSNNNGK